MYQRNVGRVVSVHTESGEKVEGWVYAESSDAIYVALDDDARNIRYIPSVPGRTTRYYDSAMPPVAAARRSAAAAIKELEASIDSSLLLALDRIDHNQLRRIGRKLAATRDKLRGIERGRSNEQAQLTLVVRSVETYQELLDELIRSGLVAQIAEHEQVLRQAINLLTIPQTVSNRHFPSAELASLIDSVEERASLSEADFGRSLLDQIDAARILELDATRPGGEEKASRNDALQSTLDCRLRKVTAGLEIAVGGSLAAEGVMLGGLNGALDALPTLDHGWVSTKTGILTLMYTGLMLANQGLIEMVAALDSRAPEADWEDVAKLDEAEEEQAEEEEGNGGSSPHSSPTEAGLSGKQGIELYVHGAASGEPAFHLEDFINDQLSEAMLEAMLPEADGSDVAAQDKQLATQLSFEFEDKTIIGKNHILEIHEGFLASHQYRLAVGIGFLADVRFGGGEPPQPLEWPIDSYQESIELHVAVFPRGPLRIEDPLDTLTWPAAGPSVKNAEFDIEVSEVNQEECGRLDVFFYYQTNLLYIARLSIVVQPDDYEWQVSERPITWIRMEDECRSTVFRQFSAINNLHERGLNLTIEPSGKPDEYLMTAFIGRAQYPARIHLTRQELTDNWVRTRALMDELRKEPAFSEGGYSKDRNYTGDFSKEGHTKLGTKAQSPIKLYEKHLKDIAQLGSKFWDSLFRSESGQELRKVIEAHLRERDIIQIYIGKGANEFAYPWAWLYSETLDPYYKVTPEKERFWGYRYIIEQLIGLNDIYDPIPADDLTVKIGVANIQPTTQEEYFADLRKRGNGRPEFEIWNSDKPWQDFLQRCDSQILYFFCHGHTAKPGSISQSIESLAKFEEWVQALPASEDQDIEHKKELLDFLKEIADPDLLDRTFIRLREGYLLLEELNNLMKLERVHPIVFLNMCESAQIFPDISEGLVSTFMKKGARSVIGTEIPMPPAFADLFAKEFFDALFANTNTPNSVGDILWALRRKYLDKNNPFGFAYTCFGDVTTRITKPAAVAHTIDSEEL